MSEALATTRVVAILRAENASRAEAVVDVLLANGIRSLELTLTTKGALEVVERLAATVPEGTDLGVGTVLTADEVDRAVDAGARFVVSPSVVPAVIEAATRHGIASYPGAFTPTEIHAAWTAGASAVKLFPGGALGPGYLKAVRAPLPDIPLVPTGGVAVEAVGAWLGAGGAAGGPGGPLGGGAVGPGGGLGGPAQRGAAGGGPGQPSGRGRVGPRRRPGRPGPAGAGGVRGGGRASPVTDDDGGLVTLGETLGLLVAEDVGPLSLARGMRLSMGGAESNVAIGVARLGVAATWIGRLGDDPIGDLIERQLLAERVRCLVQRDPSPTAIMLRERRTGTAARVSYYRHGSAGSHLQPADIPDGVVENAGLLHLSGITPALGPGPAETVREAMRRARQAGGPLSVDLNFPSRLWDAATPGPVVREPAAGADLP